MPSPDDLRRAVKQHDVETLWSLLCTYADHSNNGSKNTKTRSNWRVVITSLKDYVDHHPRSDLCHFDEHQYVDWLLEQSYSLSSVRTFRSVTRMLINALQWAGVKEAQYSRRTTIKQPKTKLPARLPYTWQELEILLKNSDPEERLILLLGLDLGLNAREMVDLRREQLDVTVEPASVRLPMKAGGEVRLTVTPRLRQALKQWLRSYTSSDDFILPARQPSYLDRRLRALCDRSHVPYEKRGVAGLRLTAGAIRYHQTKSLAAVREFLRIKAVKGSREYQKAAGHLE